MDPEAISDLIQTGGTAAVLWPACFMLYKSIRALYEKRIEALESAVKDCESDRKELWEKLLEVAKK